MALHLCSQCFRLSILSRYPGDTLKWKKGTSRHQSSSSFQHNHISKFQKGKTQHNLIPNGTDTLGKFRTYKNAGKNINVPNHVFQNTSWTQHAPTSRNLSPQLNATKQVNALSFQMGCICQADLQRLVKKKSYLQKKNQCSITNCMYFGTKYVSLLLHQVFNLGSPYSSAIQTMV